MSEGEDARFRWAANAPSGRTIRYRIETKAANGIGHGGTGWWDFGTQTGTSFTFRNVQLSDNGTVVRVTATNGFDRLATTQAMLTVTEAETGCWVWASDGQHSCGPCYWAPAPEFLDSWSGCHD